MPDYDPAVAKHQVYGDARVFSDARVFGNAQVSGNALVFGDAQVYGDARVSNNAEIIWISKIGSRLGTTIAYKNQAGSITVTCGCFCGSLQDFAAQVKQVHENNKYGKEYQKLIELFKIHFDMEAEGNE